MRSGDRDPAEPRSEQSPTKAADRAELARLRAMTPAERLAEAIEISRVATRLAAEAPDAPR